VVTGMAASTIESCPAADPPISAQREAFRLMGIPVPLM